MAQRALQILSSMATRELLAELAQRYAQVTGQPVEARAAGGIEVARRVQAGETADLVVLASDAIDRLIAGGSLLAGRVDIARSGIAVAVRAGAARPDIASERAVKRAVQDAGALGYSTGPSGAYLEKLFAGWGILEQIRARIVVPPPGVPVGALLARGEVQLGFQQLSELIRLPGIDVLGPLPDAIQSITVFSGAVAVASGLPDESRALLRFMAAANTADIKHRNGMQPGQACT